MAKGRNPKVIPDNEISRKTKEEVEAVENNTPVYESQEFIPPEDLTTEERKVWDWLVRIFRETVNCRVSDADVHLMQMYCRSKVAADEAYKAIKKDPRYYILIPAGFDKNGNEKVISKTNPNYKIWKENSELCLKYFDQLGLTPLARARVGIKGAKSQKETDLYNFLNNRTD